MDRILIITGASKGIGFGIAKAYLLDGAKVFSISRTINRELTELGAIQFAFDLQQTNLLEQLFLKIFNLIHEMQFSKITLVNNAGTLGKIGRLQDMEMPELEQTIKLNLTVPILCSKFFIAHSKDISAMKTIINITSGAAQKPYFGWSTYCSTKAALNMLTSVIAIEQAHIRALAIAPGVVDTEMQTQIRASNKADFKDIARFIALKDENQLLKPDDIGLKILEIDKDLSIESGSILRVS